MNMKRYSSLSAAAFCALLVLVGCSTTNVTPPAEEYTYPTSFLNVSGDATARRQSADEGLNSTSFIGSLEVRNYNGQGNNELYRREAWGSAFAQLQRFGDVDYRDGIEALAGSSRFNPREISNLVNAQDTSILNDKGTSDFLWQWAQFIESDISFTDVVEEKANIRIPSRDSFFGPNGNGDLFIPFTRGLFDPRTGTSINNPRQQENEITSWIDGSMIYGTNVQRVDTLREGRNSPFLRVDSENLLPRNELELANANGPIPFIDPKELFLAGDFRVNERPGLTALTTLFVREHNRLASILQEQFPRASADEIFERARRLVIAEIQAITYNEFLPALLGDNTLPAYTGYNPEINPTIYSEFSAAAYRFYDSALGEKYLRLDAAGNELPNPAEVSLQRSFFRAYTLITEENDIDPFLRGLAAQQHQRIDTRITNQLRNIQFGDPSRPQQPIGFDFASSNIKLGRDYGVSSYNDVREALGLTRKTNFNQISNDATVVASLQEAYDSVDDIDLWVGGLAETSFQNSQLGELFTTIVAKQFDDLRNGDRFWYENSLSFREAAFLGNVTLAQVIRNNTNIGAEIQDEVFFAATVGPRICEGDFTIGGPDTDGDIALVRNCTEITGTLFIQDTNLQDLSFLSNLRQVRTLRIIDNDFLTTLQGLENLSSVDTLFINNNPSFTIIEAPGNLTNINFLLIDNSTSLTTIQFPQLEQIGFLSLNNNVLLTELNFDSLQNANDISISNSLTPTTIGIFPSLTRINNSLFLGNNRSLDNIGGFENLTSIGSRLVIVSNRTLSTIDGFSNLESVGSRLLITNNPNLASITAFNRLRSVGAPGQSGVVSRIANNANFDCTAYSNTTPAYFPLTDSTGNRVNCFVPSFSPSPVGIF